MIDANELVEQYVAMWHEPGADARRKIITDLFAPDATDLVEPPQEIRERARSVGFPPPALEARGYDELAARVTRAYEEFIAPGQYIFRSRGNAARLANIVKFNWEMVATADGTVAGAGLDVFVVDDDGRIRTLYQFIEQ